MDQSKPPERFGHPNSCILFVLIGRWFYRYASTVQTYTLGSSPVRTKLGKLITDFIFSAAVLHLLTIFLQFLIFETTNFLNLLI